MKIIRASKQMAYFFSVLHTTFSAELQSLRRPIRLYCPISYWLECRDLCFVYKYMSGSFNVQLEDYIQVSSGRTRSSTDSLSLYPVHRLRTSLFRDSFFNRVVKLWNNLPLEILK
jgi:hypothetical protein